MSKPSFSSSGFSNLAIALLTKRDYERARLLPGFARWRYHADFLAERDALHVSYGAAGVTAARQRVSFEAFERWARLTGAPLTLDGLDEFAAHWRWRLAHPRAPTLGRFGGPGDPERHPLEAGGAQCVVVRPEVYVRWRDEFLRSGLVSAPNLDAYAAHVVDCCLSPSRASRPAVNSA